MGHKVILILDERLGDQIRDIHPICCFFLDIPDECPSARCFAASSDSSIFFTIRSSSNWGEQFHLQELRWSAVQCAAEEPSASDLNDISIQTSFKVFLNQDKKIGTILIPSRMKQATNYHHEGQQQHQQIMNNQLLGSFWSLRSTSFRGKGASPASGWCEIKITVTFRMIVSRIIKLLFHVISLSYSCYFMLYYIISLVFIPLFQHRQCLKKKKNKPWDHFTSPGGKARSAATRGRLLLQWRNGSHGAASLGCHSVIAAGDLAKMTDLHFWMSLEVS